MARKMSKAAAEVLRRMQENPEADFLPVSRSEEGAADRLLSLGLVTYGPGRESDYFGLRSPTYLLTEAGWG